MKESKAKAFMFTCIGLLAVCAAVQITIPATAQLPEASVAAALRDAGTGRLLIVMDNGDIYSESDAFNALSWYYNSNVLEAGPISNTESNLGDVKRAFR